MSNAAKSFLTGFMGEAAKQIKDENERLENYALTRANQLIKEMDEFDEEKKQLTNELKQQARDLSIFIASANPELTRAQVEQRVSGILLKGQGKRVVGMFEDAQKSGRISRQMADVFKPANDIADQGEDVVQETIRKMTTGVTVPGRGAGVMPQRGAYGLPSTAYTDVMQQAAATRGLTLDQFGAKRLPTIEEVGAPSDARLDLSVFAEPDEETLTKRENAARTKILDAETDEEREQGLNELNRILTVKDIGKDKEDKLKESDVRSNLRILDATIKQSIAGPGDLVVITDPVTGERSFEYSKDIDPNVRNEIERKRREEFNRYIRQHYQQAGKVPDVVQRVTNAFLLGGTSPDKERLRADANQKIAQNPAIADQVRAEFKRLTGEDL